jgi:hypothetical protein
MDDEEQTETRAEDIAPPPQPVYEHTINGKAVLLKRRVLGKDAQGLPEMIHTIGDVLGEPTRLAPLGAALIEAWEFEGSPADPAAYGELDVFDEVFPLAEVLVDYFNVRIARMAKAKN